MQQISVFEKKVRQIDDQDIPKDFKCPIGYQIMQDPVILEDGHSYQRVNIVQCLSRKLVSPITNQKLTSKKIRPNFSLKKVIHDFVQNYGQTKKRKEREKQLIQDTKQAALQQQKIIKEIMSTPKCSCQSEINDLKDKLHKYKMQAMKYIQELHSLEKQLQNEKIKRAQYESKILEHQQSQPLKQKQFIEIDSNVSLQNNNFRITPNRQNSQFKLYFYWDNKRTQVCTRNSKSSGGQHYITSQNSLLKNSNQNQFSIKVLRLTDSEINIGIITEANLKKQNYLTNFLSYKLAWNTIICDGNEVQTLEDQQNKTMQQDFQNEKSLFDCPFEITVKIAKKQKRITWKVGKYTLACCKIPNHYLKSQLYALVGLSHEKDSVKFQ